MSYLLSYGVFPPAHNLECFENNNNIPSLLPWFSSSWTNRVEVSSFTLLTARSAIPFVSDRCVSRCVMIPRQIFASFCELQLHWSARDVIFVHECRRVPYFRKFCPILRLHWRCFSPHTVQSLTIHVRLFSIDFRLVAPSEMNNSKVLFAKFCHKEIPQKF